MQIRQRVLASLLMSSLLLQSGCGTLLHPERRGQLPGRIDPAVAVLNGLGCLLFLVPGLIAFAVDFTTGAIYLPGNNYSLAPEQLGETVDSEGHIDLARLQAIIYQETGVRLPLDHPQLVQSPASTGQLATLQLTPGA